MKAKPVLSEAVVQGIFRRLYLRYGADWNTKYEGAPMAELVKEWAQGLGDLQPHEVQHALEHLPDYPPNLPTFRRIACEAPRPDRFAALPAPQERKTFAQQARVAAYRAHIAKVQGNDALADAARVECAALVEKARDAGEECRSVSELERLVLDEIAEARRERIAREIHEKRIKPETLREVPGLRFDLKALRSRIGTNSEQPRDWARMILARAERGGNITTAAYGFAVRALLNAGERVDVHPMARDYSRLPRVHYPLNETRAEALERRALEPLNDDDGEWVRRQIAGGRAW